MKKYLVVFENGTGAFWLAGGKGEGKKQRRWRTECRRGVEREQG